MRRSVAFSPHDVCTIIHQLACTGSWRGERRGVAVRLVRYSTAKGDKICFALKAGVSVNGSAETVAAAIAECNVLIEASRIRRLVLYSVCPEEAL
jgi:hypothetical protein